MATSKSKRNYKRKASVEIPEEKKASVEPVEDQMTVYFRLMKTIPLEVRKSDTIKKIRTDFSDWQGISMVNLKSLFFGGSWLDNERKVMDYNISNGGVINVFLDSGFRMPLNIKMSQLGKSITLDVEMRDTIIGVKQKIQHIEGIAVGQQDLIYMGEQLEDSKIVASYNILKGAVIYAFFRVGDTLDINVDLQQNKKTISLRVKNWYIIENIKDMIESTEGIPANKQKLMCNGVKVDNEKTVGELNVLQGQTFDLWYGMQIYVDRTGGHTMMFEVDGSHTTVADLYKMIEECGDGIHVENQRLIYNGSRLDHRRTLDYYEITDNCRIDLVLTACGC